MSTTTLPEPALQSPTASRLARAKTNLAYLALGKKAATAPSSIAVRSALTTVRYAVRYAIRRILRYAKYAAVGAIATALGGTLLGTLGSGVAFFAAPGIGVGMAIGVITAAAKFGWRHRGNHLRGFGTSMKERSAAGSDPAQDEALDAKGKRTGASAGQQKKEDVWMRV